MSANCATKLKWKEAAVVAGKGTADARVSIRVPREVMKRAEGLRPRIAKDRSVAMLGKVTQSTVLKLALMRGLDALEREYT
jgi:hypothetical protein